MRKTFPRRFAGAVETALQPLEPRRLLSAAVAPLDPDLNVSAPSTEHVTDKYWTNYESLPAARGRGVDIFADDFAAYAISSTAMRAKLAHAPMEFTPAAEAGLLEISIPTPEGRLARFNIAETQLMEPGLAAKFPDIKTYVGTGVDDPGAHLRMDYTPLGFHAQVLTPNGDWYVDPYFHLDQSVYASYYKVDLQKNPLNVGVGEVQLPDANEVIPPDDGGNSTEATTGTTLRTYRAAVAASGEYTAFFGGTVTAGQAAVVTAVNRVTGVYEIDLTIRLTLIADNNLLIYTNSATDPYSNSASDINVNTGAINSALAGVGGNSAYDIGHVFTTGSGGVAGLGVVGISGQKGRGTTGLPNPTGDGFYIDFVAHEMGHQFGANHSFNSVTGNCGGGNRNASHAYEPGSGSTIMAYAGICGSDNLQLNSNAYFLFDNQNEILNFVDNSIPGVGTRTATGNNVPTADAGLSYAMPTGTPFQLTGAATDADNDTLTYCWEERDLGAAQSLSTPDNGSSPIVRSRNPSFNPVRTVPPIQFVLAGLTSTTGEKLPTVSRSAFKWTLTVRDNRLNGGGVKSANMQINVVNTGSAFSITNFNSSTTIDTGSSQTLTWNVANTTAAPINATDVRITMSTDGGSTFPIELAASTPNDGSFEFTVPNNVTNFARFRIQPVNNIFFDINNIDVAIQQAVNVSATPGQPDLQTASDTGQFDNDNLTRLNNSNGSNVLSFDVSGTVAGATVVVLADGTQIGSAVASGTTTTITTTGAFTLSNLAHTITARQTEPGKSQSPNSTALGVTVDAAAPGGAILAFDRNVAPHRLQAFFTEDVGWSVDGADLSLTNTSGGAGAGAASAAFAVNTATWTFPARPDGILDDGNYSAAVAAADIQDVAGNPLVAPLAGGFFFLAGDANGDRSVNISDFSILASNFNLPGNFSAGDFNYSTSVEIGDFSILASKFNTSLPTPRPAAEAAPAGVTRLFSAVPFAENRDLKDLLGSEPAYPV